MVLSSALIIYDDDCFLCAQLAQFIVARQPAAFTAQGFKDWQAAADAADHEPGRALLVQLSDRLLVDDEAWEYLLSHYRDLDAISWLAAKVGIHRQAAKALKRAGQTVRLFCRRCKTSRR